MINYNANQKSNKSFYSGNINISNQHTEENGKFKDDIIVDILIIIKNFNFEVILFKLTQVIG